KFLILRLWRAPSPLSLMNPLISPNDAEFSEAFDPSDLRSFEEGVEAFQDGQIGWRRLDAQDIRRIAANLGIPLSTLGELIGMTRRSVYRWLDDPSSISIQVSVALAFIDVCGEEAFRVMVEEARRMDEARGLIREAPAEPAKAEEKERKTSGVPEVFGAKEVVELRRRLRVSRASLAIRLDVSESTVAKWEQGQGVAKGPALIALRLLWKNGRKALDV
ncbi:DNA-binding transcriptional regulator, partial [Sutterella sp.]|uniref:helix-turn-helix domain-containing protein n=1 Tax=Sutterella sp. TaxID=1981025 RepID=UPI0026E0AB41